MTFRKTLAAVALVVAGTAAPPALGDDAADLFLNCRAATSEHERFLCSNDDLMQRDQRLNAVFAALYRQKDAEGRRQMAGEQAEWMETRAACGTDYACTADLYAERMAVLTDELDRSEPPSRPVGQDGFGVVENAEINGYDRETYPDMTVEICKLICIRRPWCKSFDFERTSADCTVKPVSEHDVGGLWLEPPGEPVDHYFYAPRIRN